eukprot:UN26932
MLENGEIELIDDMDQGKKIFAKRDKKSGKLEWTDGDIWHKFVYDLNLSLFAEFVAGFDKETRDQFWNVFVPDRTDVINEAKLNEFIHNLICFYEQQMAYNTFLPSELNR